MEALAEHPGQRRQHRHAAGIGGWIQRAGQKRGEALGANPTDRGRNGTKHHIAVDARGVPVAVALSPANVHDSRMMIPVLDAITPIQGPRGRPRRKPGKLHADKGYDYPRCRQALRDRRIVDRIARRGIESKKHLGRHRWVVERTFAWLKAFRRLQIRYERIEVIHRTFLVIGCIMICWRALDVGF
jgi:transposase